MWASAKLVKVSSKVERVSSKAERDIDIAIEKAVEDGDVEILWERETTR